MLQKNIITSVLLIGTLLFSCKKEPSILPQQFKDSNYIPLETGKTFTYTKIGSRSFGIDTLVRIIKKDTLVDGNQYKLVYNYLKYTNQLVRKSGDNYFSRNLSDDTTEILFMKDNIKAGDHWTVTDTTKWFHHFEFSVTEIKPIEIINGKEYNNVAVIKKEIFNDGKLWLTSQHHYAPNIGEIFSFLPYPLGNEFQDIQLNLIKSE